MRTLNLPIARGQYDRQEEQVFRERIRSAIESCVGREQLFNPLTNKPLFFGQPHAKAVGTNSSLSVAASTATHLPLPTIQISNANLISGSEFVIPRAMDVEFTYNIYHSSVGANNVLVTAHLSSWNGSVYSDLFSEAVHMDMTKQFSLYKTVMLVIPGATTVRLRVTHADAGANDFDLTKSWMTAKQLGIDSNALPSMTL